MGQGRKKGRTVEGERKKIRMEEVKKGKKEEKTDN